MTLLIIVNWWLPRSQGTETGEIDCTLSRSCLALLASLMEFLCPVAQRFILSRSEPEAAAVHCVHLTKLRDLRIGQTFMICDAGGGTVVGPMPIHISFMHISYSAC